MSRQAKKTKFLFFKLSRHHYLALLLIIIVLAVFARSYRYEFLSYDDGINIYENPHVKQFDLSYFWKKPYKGMYIPLTYNLWAFQAKLAKIPPAESAGIELKPHVFHTTNIIVHLLSMLVVFSILRILVRNDWAACAGALLFAIHPVQVEPVVWVTGLKNVLSGLLSLLAIWQYLSYASLNSPRTASAGRLKGIGSRKRSTVRRRQLHYIVAIIAFVLAILSMPIAIVVPLVAGLLSYLILRRSPRQCVVELVPWLALGLPIIILTKLAQPDVTIDFIVAFWKRPLIAGDALMFYLYKLILPISLGPDYGRTPNFVLKHGWIFLTGIIPYMTAIVLAWKYRRPWLLASGGALVAGVMPVLGFVPFVFQNFSTVADRYLYIAMLGPALALAWFLSGHRSMLMRIIFVLILGTLGLRSVHQTQYWKNSYTFFKHALAVNSNSWLAHNNVGIAQQKTGELEEAIAHYNEALRLKPDYELAHNNLGVVLEKQGKLEEAIAHYNEALRLKPDKAEAHSNLGNLLQGQDKLEEAIAHFDKALKLKPNYAGAHYNLAIALQKMDKLEEAIAHYTEALKLKPNYVLAHNNLGTVFQQQGKFEKAIAQYAKALRIDPNYAEAHNNLGTVLQKQGKLREAIAHYTEALKSNPDYADAHNNLGAILQKQGKLEAATAHFEGALRLNPDNAKAHNKLGRVLQRQDKLEEAIAHYEEALRLNPNNAKAHNNLGAVLNRQSKLEEAVSHFTQAIKLKPDYAKAHNNLGTVLLNQNKLKEAIAHFTEALKFKPNIAEVHNKLGFVLEKQSKHEEAAAHFTEALRLKPNFAEAHNNLGIALHQQGKLEEAIAHYTEALRINPDFKQASRNLTKALQQKKKK